MDYEAFAEEWEAAWNSHSIDRILAHYSDRIVYRSHLAMRLVGQAELRGRDALRDYWSKTLAQQPDLSFVIVDVFYGHAMIVITYRDHRDALAAETLRFGADGMVIEASSCHAR